MVCGRRINRHRPINANDPYKRGDPDRSVQTVDAYMSRVMYASLSCVFRSNRLTARSLGAGGLHSSHGEAFFPGLMEEQSEAFRDGVPIGRDFDGG